MNVIDYYSAICLYPMLTLHSRTGIILRKEDAVAIRKYEQRGWQMISDPSLVSTLLRCSSGNNSARRVGDSRSFTIPLITEVNDMDTLSDPWHLRDHWWRLEVCSHAAPIMSFYTLALRTATSFGATYITRQARSLHFLLCRDVKSQYRTD